MKNQKIPVWFEMFSGFIGIGMIYLALENGLNLLNELALLRELSHAGIETGVKPVGQGFLGSICTAVVGVVVMYLTGMATTQEGNDAEIRSQKMPRWVEVFLGLTGVVMVYLALMNGFSLLHELDLANATGVKPVGQGFLGGICTVAVGAIGSYLAFK